MTSNGDSLGTESTIQLPRNAASDLVSKMGHSWIRCDTVVNDLRKASARLRTAEWRQDLRCNETGSCATSLARCLFARTSAPELASV